MTDEELARALKLFRESGTAWSEHWMTAPAAAVRAPRRSGWYVAMAAAAVAAIAAILAMRSPAPKQQVAAQQPFVQIPFVAPPAPYERVEIAPRDVPVAELIAAGFDMPAADPGATVRAEVLLGQDGRAHAIRLMGRSSN
jgi:hypothetical protein